MLTSAFIMLYITITMLVVATTAIPWSQSLINTQHILNEVVFYTICACLVAFSCITDLYQSLILGWLLIVLISYLIIYNLIIIAYYTLSFLKLLLIRYNRFLPRRLGNFVSRSKGNCCFCFIKRKKELTKQ